MAASLGSYTDRLAIFGTITLGYVILKVGVVVFRVLKRAVCRSFPLDFTKFGRWAVITGATDGIGKSYALQLAEKGMDIVLISRTPQKLSAVAEEIGQQYKVAVKTIAADFKKTDIYEHIKQQLSGLDIGILVNNVGMIYDKSPEYFCDTDDLEQLNRDIINVNILSCVMMTGIVLPDMLERKRGTIVNLSSGAGIRPLPFFAIYSATKAFVVYFSEALNMEYSTQGVTVQVVLPNLVQSNMSSLMAKAGNLNGGPLYPTSDQFVRKAVRTIGRESSTSPHWPHELQQQFLKTLIPDSTLRSGMLQMRNRIQELLKTQ